MHVVSEALAPTKRPQSLGEEIANSVSHGVALLVALGCAPVLIIHALRSGGPARVVGVSVFVSTALLLYLASTLYHALPRGRVKEAFQVLDHVAIFLLIAGTYTAFTLGVLRGAWGWTLLGLVWGLAGAGIVLKALTGERHPKLSMFLYLATGWLALVWIEPLLRHLALWGFLWILAGGFAYTVGVGFYARGARARYTHFVWHLFVIAGTTCHFVAVLAYVA